MNNPETSQIHIWKESLKQKDREYQAAVNSGDSEQIEAAAKRLQDFLIETEPLRPELADIYDILEPETAVMISESQALTKNLHRKPNHRDHN